MRVLEFILWETGGHGKLYADEVTRFAFSCNLDSNWRLEAEVKLRGCCRRLQIDEQLQPESASWRRIQGELNRYLLISSSIYQTVWLIKMAGRHGRGGVRDGSQISIPFPYFPALTI